MRMKTGAAAGCLLAAVQVAALGQPAKPKVGPWEVHEGPAQFKAFKTDTPEQRKQALDEGVIPPAGDGGWNPAPTVSGNDAAAKYTRQSKVTKPKQELDFTYFQSIVTIPAGFTLSNFEVFYDSVDDAARVWIFNEKFPKGTFLPEADVVSRQVRKATADMKAFVTTGDNRVVIVQYDQHPPGNDISGIRIKLNGSEVKAPTEAEIGVILYDGENFQGLKLPYTEGTHDIYSSQVGLNDLVSSVKVKPGWKVTLYEHFKMGGRSLVLTADTAELRTKQFNNITSGVKIEKIR